MRWSKLLALAPFALSAPLLAQEHLSHGRFKDVTLYRQGQIRFAVNAEPAPDARGRFTEEPACVCSLGLFTQHPSRAARSCW